MSKVPWKKLLIGELSWRRLVRSLLFIYAFFALYVFFRADSMIFMPQPASYRDDQNILKLPVNATERISALHLINPKATYTLLYIHGNASDLGDNRPFLEQLQRWGFSVFAYDYRGYGTSDGRPSEQNAYQDAEVAYRYLTKQLKIPASRIIVYGHSLGGGSATELALRHPVAGVILGSTFISAFRVIAPFPLLPFDKFSNLSRLRQIHCPVLVMHGQADQTIPFDHGLALYEAASAPKQFLWIPGAGHNDFTEVAGDRLRQALLSFQNLVKRE